MLRFFRRAPIHLPQGLTVEAIEACNDLAQLYTWLEQLERDNIDDQNYIRRYEEEQLRSTSLIRHRPGEAFSLLDPALVLSAAFILYLIREAKEARMPNLETALWLTTIIPIGLLVLRFLDLVGGGQAYAIYRGARELRVELGMLISDRINELERASPQESVVVVNPDNALQLGRSPNSTHSEWPAAVMALDEQGNEQLVLLRQRPVNQG